MTANETDYVRNRGEYEDKTKQKPNHTLREIKRINNKRTEQATKKKESKKY